MRHEHDGTSGVLPARHRVTCGCEGHERHRDDDDDKRRAARGRPRPPAQFVARRALLSALSLSLLHAVTGGAYAASPFGLNAYAADAVLVGDQAAGGTATGAGRAAAGTAAAGDAPFQRALSLVAQRRYAEADVLFTQVLRSEPRNVAALSNRGNVRLALKRPQDALRDYREAVQLIPLVVDDDGDAGDTATTTTTAAAAAAAAATNGHASGDTSTAARSLSSNASLAAVIRENMGTAYEALRKPLAAYRAYNEAIKLYAASAHTDARAASTAYVNRGNVEVTLGMYNDALRDYDFAARSAPGVPAYRAKEALVLAQLGRADESVQIMRQLARKYPHYDEVHAAMAAVLWRGQTAFAEAEEQWARVRRRDRARYADVDYLASVLRWPPAVIDALVDFLELKVASRRYEMIGVLK